MKLKAQIQELLDSDISAYRIGKESGVSQPIITQLRNGHRSIGRLTVNSAQKLIDYWEQVKENKQN
mgnify:CR=1 FL=1